MPMNIQWSANHIPKVGDVFVSRCPYFIEASRPPGLLPNTPLVVKGFEVEHGWLYCLAEPVEVEAKKRMKAAMKRLGFVPRKYVYVAGVDVAAWQVNAAVEGSAL
jgi:hypothetical protein